MVLVEMVSLKNNSGCLVSSLPRRVPFFLVLPRNLGQCVCVSASVPRRQSNTKCKCHFRRGFCW